MAENNGSYPNHPDPGPKPTSVGGAKFEPIGTFVDLDKTPSSPNQKTGQGTSGKIGS